MNKKIYFTGSIRGGRVDADLYKKIISYIEKTDTVLTEHVGNSSLNVHNQERPDDEMIYNRDILWLKESDMLIGECTCPSLGVGYELAYAEKLNKECHIFYCKSKCNFSAMLNGNTYFNIHPYETNDELFSLLGKILSK